MKIDLRAAQPDDFNFCRLLYYETMRWISERLFGWDQTQEDMKFAQQFKLDEVEIIVVDGCDVGWLQTQSDERMITLGQLYVAPARQRLGIGTEVLNRVSERARRARKAVILSVVKINPARHLYERHGFHATHEDQYKIYMRRDFAPDV
jgi:GNAT superfamily N-acetyltransferase